MLVCLNYLGEDRDLRVVFVKCQFLFELQQDKPIPPPEGRWTKRGQEELGNSPKQISKTSSSRNQKNLAPKSFHALQASLTLLYLSHCFLNEALQSLYDLHQSPNPCIHVSGN